MRLRSVDETAPDFVADMLVACGEQTDREYYERLAEEAPAAAAWAQGHGVAFHAPGYYLSSGPPRIQPVGGGAAAIVAALARARWREQGRGLHSTACAPNPCCAARADLRAACASSAATVLRWRCARGR